MSARNGFTGSGLLTKNLVQTGLSLLGCTSSGSGIAYLRLCLSNKSLTDVSALCSFTHLKYLDLSHNRLKDLSHLSCLPHLMDINVSHNRLTNMMDFAPPNNLQCIDYSYNEIEEFPKNFDQFWSLNKLILDGNQITSLSGVSVLVCLTHLSMADNRIDTITGLDNLPIKTLNLAGNSISCITGIQSLQLLEVINLSSNQITSLNGLSGFNYLSDINLEENQIVDLNEIAHLEGLCQLNSLNLKRNPVQTLPSYKQYVLVALKHLMHLDGLDLFHQEKVSAKNRYNPTRDLLASQNHMHNVVKSIRKQARLNFSTLTQPDEPYPMLVLCGPPGSGKEHYAQELVDEFPSFFGLGVSHTTRPQGVNESHGRHYYFINEVTFKRAVEAGEFIQTVSIAGHWYGLTLAAVEQVAQQGLACVCHLTLEGVLTLKNSHFEPRYILLLPLNKQIHEERLRSFDHTDDEIFEALQEVDQYLQIHQDRPGFFDATINTDRINEGYNILRTIVMAYGGISPETPLTLSLSASRPTTQQSSSSLSSYGIIIDDDGGTSNPGTAAVTSTVLPQVGTVPSSKSAPVGHVTSKHVNNDDYTLQSNILAQSWSRPSTSSDSQSIRGGGLHVKRVFSDESTQVPRKEKQIRALAKGKLEDTSQLL